MRVTPQGVARLEGLRYYAFKIQGLGKDAVPTATFCADGIALEVPLLLDEQLADDLGLWIAVFPYLDTASQSLTICDDKGTVLWIRTLSPRGMDLNNSVTCRVKKRLSARMRGCEKRLCLLIFIERRGEPFQGRSSTGKVPLHLPDALKLLFVISAYHEQETFCRRLCKGLAGSFPSFDNQRGNRISNSL